MADNLLINLEKLVEQDLTPNEYVALRLIETGRNNHPLVTSETIITLKERKLIDENVKTSENRKKVREKLDKWLLNWLSLWPTQILPGRYRVSGNSMECKKRMGRFMRNFPQYTPEIIMEATRIYLKNQENNGWAYTKKNAKFIYDSETSTLEQECEAYVNGDSSITSENNSVDF